VNEIFKYTIKITAVCLHIATNTLGYHINWQEFGRSIVSWLRPQYKTGNRKLYFIYCSEVYSCNTSL